MLFLDKLIDRFAAWQRQDVRIAPYGTRGRVFEKSAAYAAVNQVSDGMNVDVKSKPVVTCEIKIIRADGTVETQTVPAELVIETLKG